MALDVIEIRPFTDYYVPGTMLCMPHFPSFSATEVL